MLGVAPSVLLAKLAGSDNTSSSDDDDEGRVYEAKFAELFDAPCTVLKAYVSIVRTYSDKAILSRTRLSGDAELKPAKLEPPDETAQPIEAKSEAQTMVEAFPRIAAFMIPDTKAPAEGNVSSPEVQSDLPGTKTPVPDLVALSPPVPTFLDVILRQYRHLKPHCLRELLPYQVTCLLNMKNLETCCEIPVFMAALVWLNVDYANRSAHAAEVMSCVRFTHMTSEELLHCFFPPLRPEVIEIPAVRKHLTAGCIQRLPNALEAEADLLLHLNIQRETYLQRRVLGSAASDTEQFKVTRLYAIAKGLVQRHRFLVLHYHDP
ncbi:hypothetical protein HPB47_013796, partial [Ixodes persulcatus]